MPGRPSGADKEKKRQKDERAATSDIQPCLKAANGLKPEGRGTGRGASSVHHGMEYARKFGKGKRKT
jgi:hypothetical protein